MDQIKLTQKRTVQYWYNDGLNEIGFGALLLLLGAYFLLEGSLDASHPLRPILESGFVFIIVAGGLLTNKLIRMGKERLTYQRTGYVSYPRQKAPILARILLAVTIALVMAGSVALLSTYEYNADKWLPAISGLLFGAVFFYFGLRTGIIRFLVVSLLAVVAGVGIVLAGVVGSIGIGIFYTLTGSGLILSGIWTLFTYLRRNPEQAEQSNEP